MFTKYVDPFWGNGEMKLPEPQGVAASWFFIKAQSGNTSPAASLPFSMVRVQPYTGGYPAGSGINCPNTHGRVKKMSDTPKINGFTHFCQNGTGAMGYYYNYVRVMPYNEDFKETECYYPLEKEYASPGLYQALIGDLGISASLTVTRKAALHHYEYAKKNAHLRVELGAEGLSKSFGSLFSSPCTRAKVEKISDSEIRAEVVFHDFALYVCVLIPNEKNVRCTLYQNNGEKIQDILECENPGDFGALFDACDAAVLDASVGFSFKDTEQASLNAKEACEKDFSSRVKEAETEWEEHLSKVEIQTKNESQKKLFYSALYTSLIKPMDCPNESPYWNETEFYTDFCTLWDIYKTQFPLIFSLYPEHAAGIVNTLISHNERDGYFRNYFVMANPKKDDHPQARMLSAYIFADAFNRHVPQVDYKRALRAIERDARHENNRDFMETGICPMYTHILDMADSAFYTAQLAESLGEPQTAEEFSQRSNGWKNAYDTSTGLLSEKSDYYEGTLWNYSFRLLHNMDERIALCAGKKNFTELLERFFGFGAEPVRQIETPEDKAYYAWGHALHRFEGFNNEPDMETPYNYIFADRFDRLCEIIRASLDFMFCEGVGGLPGNEDSGGLSSCLIWNMLGIFPVVGARTMLLGSPILDGAVLKLAGNKSFSIKVYNNSDKNIYVQQILFNGKERSRPILTVDEFMSGGTLEFHMTHIKEKCICSCGDKT